MASPAAAVQNIPSPAHAEAGEAPHIAELRSTVDRLRNMILETGWLLQREELITDYANARIKLARTTGEEKMLPEWTRDYPRLRVLINDTLITKYQRELFRQATRFVTWLDPDNVQWLPHFLHTHCPNLTMVYLDVDLRARHPDFNQRTVTECIANIIRFGPPLLLDNVILADNLLYALGPQPADDSE